MKQVRCDKVLVGGSAFVSQHSTHRVKMFISPRGQQAGIEIPLSLCIN